MTTTSGGKGTASQPGQKNGDANIGVYRGPEDTMRLNLFLLLGPEGSGEVVVEGRVLRVEFMRPKQKAQACTLNVIQSAPVNKITINPAFMRRFRLTAAAHAPSVDRAWMPLKDCRAGILDTSTPSCASPSVTLKFDASITSAFARANPPTADKAPNTDHGRILARGIDSRKKGSH